VKLLFRGSAFDFDFEFESDWNSISLWMWTAGTVLFVAVAIVVVIGVVGIVGVVAIGAVWCVAVSSVRGRITEISLSLPSSSGATGFVVIEGMDWKSRLCEDRWISFAMSSASNFCNFARRLCSRSSMMDPIDDKGPLLGEGLDLGLDRGDSGRGNVVFAKWEEVMFGRKSVGKGRSVD